MPWQALPLHGSPSEAVMLYSLLLVPDGIMRQHGMNRKTL